ncbi:hypothetical protein OEZ85_004302 [Tetradesmus obliquus]|uniref:Uncharacterized protein n=1 Tax=Tetradesmus obliquus TaxID=3088 RepID=A0ABY8UNJ9_TETOB|nr:hypothetical protein OEZ85_004302 [Tetradesmus obliquus]
MSQPREKLEPPALSPLERQLLINAPSPTSRPNIGTLPPSSVLGKVRSFLPQMKQANEQLEQQLQLCDPSVVDIEHIPEGADAAAPVIQMDLACGLLDLKDDAALAAAQRAIAAGGDVAVEAFDGGSSSGSDSDSSSSEDEGDELGSSSSSGGSELGGDGDSSILSVLYIVYC